MERDEDEVEPVRVDPDTGPDATEPEAFE